MKQVLMIAALVSCLAGVAFAFQPAAPQDDFVPAASLPAAESLPAAPMVIAAYAFVWVALLVYVWSIWRRMQKVEGELADLERRARER
jgi:CcmD family protein